MIKTNCSQSGVTLLEVLIAITIVVIAFVGLVKLTGTTASNTDYVSDLSRVNLLVSSKATDLMDKVDIIATRIPIGQASIGATAPSKPVDGFYDIFDESGKPLCSVDVAGVPNCLSIAQKDVRAFVRQWKIVKDFPTPGDLSVLVSVSHTTSKKVLRSVCQTRTESILKQ